MENIKILTEEEIKLQLENYPLWEIKDNTIVREIVTVNFTVAVGVVNSIAIIAEILDHHPDILLYAWNKIRVISCTHDKGGITSLDFELAKKIDSLKF